MLQIFWNPSTSMTKDVVPGPGDMLLQQAQQCCMDDEYDVGDAGTWDVGHGDAARLVSRLGCPAAVAVRMLVMPLPCVSFQARILERMGAGHSQVQKMKKETCSATGNCKPL